MTVINVAQISLKTIDLSPGSHLLISDVTWEQYEALLEELGEDRRVPRINYYNGVLELMSPLAAHERPHRELIPRLVNQAFQQGTSIMLRALRQRMQDGGQP